MKLDRFTRWQSRSVYRKTFLGLIGLLALSLATCSNLGCLKKPVLTEGSATTRLLVAFNTSGSSREELPAGFTFAAQAVTAFDSDSTWLSVWRTDHETTEVYSGPAYSSRESMTNELTPTLENMPADSQSHLAPLWEMLATHCQTTTAPCAIMLVGDGFGEGDTAADHARIAAAAQILAKSSVVEVAFVGVRPGAYEAIERDFAALGDRLCFLTFEQAGDFVARTEGKVVR